MNEISNWEKLIALPKGVIKEQGRFKGEYTISINYIDGTWFIEYIYSGFSFSDEDITYLDTFAGYTLEEAVNKASTFFENSWGKYKLIG